MFTHYFIDLYLSVFYPSINQIT